MPGSGRGSLGHIFRVQFSGIADIDAITISSAKWASADTGQTEFAASVIILAILSNTVFKAVLSYVRGSAELGKAVVSGFGIILVAGLSVAFGGGVTCNAVRPAGLKYHISTAAHPRS
jgi:uncharacterized membrane protein (DUF4010 family)